MRSCEGLLHTFTTSGCDSWEGTRVGFVASSTGAEASTLAVASGWDSWGGTRVGFVTGSTGAEASTLAVASGWDSWGVTRVGFVTGSTGSKTSTLAVASGRDSREGMRGFVTGSAGTSGAKSTVRGRAATDTWGFSIMPATIGRRAGEKASFLPIKLVATSRCFRVHHTCSVVGESGGERTKGGRRIGAGRSLTGKGDKVGRSTVVSVRSVSFQIVSLACLETTESTRVQSCCTPAPMAAPVHGRVGSSKTVQRRGSPRRKRLAGAEEFLQLPLRDSKSYPLWF